MENGAKMEPSGSVLESIMPSLSIKDVPESLLIAIRQRAARNHRSLQGELMALLEAAAALEPPFLVQPQQGSSIFFLRWKLAKK